MKDVIKTTATPKKAVKRQRLFTESPSGKAIRQSLEKSKKAEDIQTKIIDLRSNLQDNMNIEYLSSCDMQTKLTLLHLILGLPTLLTLISSYIHVPQMFPNRLSYILKIVNEDSSVTVSAEDMLVFIQTLESCANLLNNYSIDIVNILWKVSAKYKESFMKFETPPVTVCIQDDCQGTLYPSSKTSVTFYTLIGPCPGQKATLRCRTCQTYYNIDGFHVTNQGTYYYPVQYTTKWIRASNLVYFSKDLHEFMCEAANHAFVSSQGFAEIYNSVFTECHPVAVNFHQWAKQLAVQIDHEPSTVNLYEATNLCDEDDFHKQNSADANTSVQISMTRKNTVSALLNGELQNELNERGLTDLTVFTTTNNREDIMREIDILRKTELYVHTEDDCSPLCKAKGCEHLRVIDSCWKVCMCHCMFAVPMEVKGYPLLNFPNVCTMEHQHGSVFCIEHHQLLARHKIPTDKQEFLKFIGCTGTTNQVRGKANDDPRSPLSGCMVTANFDLTTLFKYFSRLLVMVIQPLQRKKSTGDAKKLEDSARLASAALPIVLSAINTTTLEDIATEVQKLELDADIRVLEGIALGITLTKKVLSVADCAKYMPDVLLYVEDQLIPYYQTSLARCLQVQKPDQPLYRGSPLEDGFEEQIISLVRENVGNGCTITKNGLAVKKDLVTPLHSAKTIRQHVQRLNGKQNHTVRLDGKPVKAILLPAASFSSIQWTTICQLLEMDEEETCVMQVHCSTVDTLPATSAATTDTALMPASTTAATVPASTTAATLPATTKAATKPATKPATTTVTTLTATRSATQPATNTTTAIERPVSTTTTATTTAATLPTITTATTKSATTDAALMPPATKPVTTTTTITSVTTLAATTSATQPVTTTTAISEPVSTTATATTSTATTTAATLPAITTATTKPATTDAALMPPATKPVTTTAAITSVTTLAATTSATQPVTTATAISEPVSTTATAITSTATTTAATLPPITTATRKPATTDVALLPPATKPVTTNTTAITSVTTLTATSSATLTATTTATQPAIAEPVCTTSTATTRAINLPVPNQRMRKSGDICQGCRKEGKPNLLWIQCTSCMLWYHRICSGLTVIQFKQKVRKDNIVWNCTKCQQ